MRYFFILLFLALGFSASAQAPVWAPKIKTPFHYDRIMVDNLYIGTALPSLNASDSNRIAIVGGALFNSFYNPDCSCSQWKQSGIPTSISGDTLFVGTDTLILNTPPAFNEITGDAFDNTNIYSYFYYRGLPTVATTSALASLGVTFSEKILVKGVGVVEFSPTGTPDGKTIFPGFGGVWNLIFAGAGGNNGKVTYVDAAITLPDTADNFIITTTGVTVTFPDPALHEGREVVLTHKAFMGTINSTHGIVFGSPYVPVANAANVAMAGQAGFTTARYVSDGSYWRLASMSHLTYIDNATGTGVALSKTINGSLFNSNGSVRLGTIKRLYSSDGSITFTDGTDSVDVKAIAGAGDTTNLYFQNGATSADLDSLLTNPNDSTVVIKAVGVVAGTGISITKQVGADSLKWTINATGGALQGIDTVLATGDTLTANRQLDLKNNQFTMQGGITNIGTDVTTSEVGTMWSDDFNRASLGANWAETTPSATVTLNSSVMQVSGGGSFTDYINYKDTTGVSLWTAEAEMVTSVDGNGFGFGIKSIGTNDWSLLFRFIMTGADKGKVRLYYDDLEIGGIISTSTSAYTYTNGDTLNLKLFRDDDSVHITVKKKSGTDSLVYSIPYYPGVLGASLMHNTGSIRMYFFGGTYDINTFSYAINENKNSFAFLGNSITTGYRASIPKYRWVNRVFSNRDRFNIVGGAGDFTSSATYLIKDLDSLRPTHIVYAMGVNDARAAISTATFSSNVQVIANYAQANAIEMVIVGTVPANTVDVTPYNDTLQAIATRYGFRYVDIFSSLRKIGTTTWNPTYADADSIHPNDSGMRLIGDLVTQTLTEISQLYIYETQLENSPDFELVLKNNKVYVNDWAQQVDLTPVEKQSGEVWVTDVLTDSLKVGTMPSGIIKGTATIGATTTSASEYALRVVNSANTNLFTVKNDGAWFGVPIAEVSLTRLRFAGSSQQITATNTTTQTTAAINFTPHSQFRGTAGTQQNHIRISSIFDPTSGTSPFTDLLFASTINQTGGASGIVRSIHINPTITAAADYRAIEVATGKSYFRSLHLTTAGDKLNIAIGSNASIGTATLVAGTVTVSTTAVTASSIIMVSVNTPGGTLGYISAPVASITAGTSFVINSSSASDTSTINWWIIN